MYGELIDSVVDGIMWCFCIFILIILALVGVIIYLALK